MANERRIDELMNINNRYVRTERHLEQHPEFSDPENLEHASNIQKEREDRMDNLKNIIAYGKHEEEDEVENLKRNIEYTDNYLEENADRMDEFTLNKAMEKQSHRREQLEFLE
ncbi:MAG: hypothetical protein GX352_02800 [Clostridiales bacterium]|nr:hypothetical protein [Clostridiales bacterium]